MSNTELTPDLIEQLDPKYRDVARMIPAEGIGHPALARMMYPDQRTKRGAGRVLRLRRTTGGRNVVPDEWRTGADGFRPVAWYYRNTALELLKRARRHKRRWKTNSSH